MTLVAVVVVAAITEPKEVEMKIDKRGDKNCNIICRN